jgi:uncharacterized membrane protein
MALSYAVSVLMFIIGMAFFTGVAPAYMKGFQIMSEEEKGNINIKALCRHVSVLFFLTAAIFAIAGFSEVFRQTYFAKVMVGWAILCFVNVLYISRSKRFITEHDSTKKIKEGWNGKR